jgi:hypothetical protein
MTDKERISVTDTPWFWAMLFSLAALAAIATVGPKFERREEAIETKFHARERGLHREEATQGPAETDEKVAEVADSNAAQKPWSPVWTLEPLMAVIGVVVVVSVFMSLRFHQKCIAVAARAAAVRSAADSSESGSATDN